jgi:hypothetical protein
VGKEFGWKVIMVCERVISEVRRVVGDMDLQGWTAGKDRGRRWWVGDI